MTTIATQLYNQPMIVTTSNSNENSQIINKHNKQTVVKSGQHPLFPLIEPWNKKDFLIPRSN